jgi:hypothetical protein
MDVSDYLRALARSLLRSKITSTDITALVFHQDGRDINVLTKAGAHPASYPPIADLLDRIGGRFAEREISVGQLRRITFLDQEIKLEFVDQHGQLNSHNCPLDQGARSSAPYP